MKKSLLEEEATTEERRIATLQAHLEATKQRTVSWEEARELSGQIDTLAQLTMTFAKQEAERKQWLIGYPKGRPIPEGKAACAICRETAQGENSWLDKSGITCSPCQTALRKKVVPRSVVTDRESWYSTSELQHYFCLTKKLLTHCLKKGWLNERRIEKAEGKVHVSLFLLKDHKRVLPPKALLAPRTVQVIWRGEEYYTQESWWEYIDHVLAVKLAAFSIFAVLKEFDLQPVNKGRVYYKKISPLFTPNKIWPSNTQHEVQLSNNDLANDYEAK